MKKSLCHKSFISSLAVTMYIALVSWIMSSGEKIFGAANKFWAPVAMLLLFVFSALVTGMLMLGYPIWLYLENKKKESVTVLFYNIGWIFVFLVLAFFIISII